MAGNAVDDVSIFDVWPSSKHSIAPASAMFMAIGTNCSHLPIPPGGRIHMSEVDIPFNSLMGLKPVSYPQPRLAICRDVFMWV